VISEHEIQRRDGFRNGSLVSVPCISKLREARRKPCLLLALSYGSAALQAYLALDNVPTILAAPIDKIRCFTIDDLSRHQQRRLKRDGELCSIRRSPPARLRVKT